MSNCAVCFSPTGGTRKVMDVVKQRLVCEREIDLTKPEEDYGVIEFEADDVCLFAVPSFGGRVPDPAVSRISRMKGNGARAVLIAVFGNRAIDDTLAELKDVLELAGFRCAAAIEAVAEHSIMHQFASGRPDGSDISELQDFAGKIERKLQSNDDGGVTVPGKHPYKEYNGVPLKPSVNKRCRKCGKCAERCPVGAISRENPNETDTDLCISCMRCIQECPSHARKLNPMVLKAAGAGLKKACEARKANKLYLNHCQ